MMRAWLGRCTSTWGLAGLSLLATLALLEVGLHLVNFPRRQFLVTYDATLGWRNTPNARSDHFSSEYRVSLRFNSAGIRGPDRPYAKPRETYRIVVLGDSFVEGAAVALEDRVTEVLEGLLNAANPSRRVEVIAMGVAVYSTDQQLLWLESHGVKYQPDLVVLMFYYNDVWHNTQPRYGRRPKPVFVLSGETLTLTNVPVPYVPLSEKIDPVPEPRSAFDLDIKEWLKLRSKLYDLGVLALETNPWLLRLVRRAGPASPLPKGPGGDGDASPLPPEFMVYRKHPGPDLAYAWQVTRALLRRMRQDAEQIGANFLVFHVPVRMRVYTEEWAALRSRYGLPAQDWDLDEVTRNFLAICAKEATHCIEPTTRFVDAAASLNAKGERLYYRYDNHWNAHGHRLAADLLREAVRQVRAAAHDHPGHLSAFVAGVRPLHADLAGGQALDQGSDPRAPRHRDQPDPLQRASPVACGERPLLPAVPRGGHPDAGRGRGVDDGDDGSWRGHVGRKGQERDRSRSGCSIRSSRRSSASR